MSRRSLWVVLLACACTRDPPAPPRPIPTPIASTQAVDRLLPGELSEGKKQAFGLVLPRDMVVERVFDDSVVARGRVPSLGLADYIRKRVETSTIEIGDARTLFGKAHVVGQPANKLVRIEIVTEVASTTLVVHDVTPPVVVPGLSEDERWKKAGAPRGPSGDPQAF
jgi:hypothetical protein